MEEKVKSLNILLTCLFLVILSISICSAQSSKVNENKLIVKLKNIPDSTYLYIEQGTKVLDSMIVIGGRGELVIKQEKPIKIFLVNKDYKKFWYKNFWLEQSEIIVEGDYNNYKDVKVSGSKSTLLSDKLEKINNEYKTFIDSTVKLNNNNLPTKINETASSKKNWYLSETNKIVSQNNNTEVSLEWLSYQCIYNYLTKNEISNYYTLLSEKLQKDSIGLTIKKYITLPKPPQIGEKFIDFEQHTPDNKVVKLSDYYGKITLVEFWSSGCYPCRAENPNIVKLYEKYHPLGFNILGVSMDDDKERWMKAIAMDKLPWVNVSDLKGNFNVPSLIYGVYGIPSNFLINKEGIITHKILRGEVLNNTLEQIYK